MQFRNTPKPDVVVRIVIPNPAIKLFHFRFIVPVAHPGSVSDRKSFGPASARASSIATCLVPGVASKYVHTPERADWANQHNPSTNMKAARVKPYSAFSVLLAHAEAAAFTADRQWASVTQSQIEHLRSTKSESTESTVELEIHAWIDLALGRPRSAFAMLRPLAERQTKTGKNEIEIPAREMLADMLLLSGRFAEALSQYQL